jgi:Ser/Thr protein kinase RdoA (MazF antagonist)
MTQNDLIRIASLFAISGTVEEVKPLGEGLINDTFLVAISGGENYNYVLQRINTNVFPDVDMVMRNIEIVTNHIRKKLTEKGVNDIHRRVLTFIHTRNNPSKLYAYVDGNYWRLMLHIDHALTKQTVDTDNSRAAGEAFGRFQAMLADVPYELGETIKDFHNMEYRIEQLRQAAIEDRAGRFDTPEVQILLQNIGDDCEEMTKAERLYREGKLPKRVCHCDTKVNNMLFSEDGKEVLCVIDLDTVMPSFIFSDYGDFLRSAANTGAEGEADLSKVKFRMDIFRAFTEGYLSSARSFLTPIEIEMLPFAVKLFPYMQSVRFLWDYLNGDEYWKVKYPKHNLVRAQNQFRLYEKVAEFEPELISYIKTQMQ